jgi:hypothetical protein
MNPFEALEQHYPEIIQRMDKRFSSHEFIRELSHQHQGLYIRALEQYVDHDTPFMVVHGRLAQALHKFDHLIYHIGNESSTDIFGHSNGASVWGRR